MEGKLYIVSTPIGNYGDITLRALLVLKEVDFIICEEFKEARRLLSYYNIDKELFSLNEHNEKGYTEELLLKISGGKNAALISDCGTPLFSDPGSLLVELCIRHQVDVIPIPGASSLFAALAASGLNLDKFYYYGMLSPKKDLRKQQLHQLKFINELIVLLDAPYRIKSLLTDVVKVMGKSLNCVLAFQLTMKDEKFYRGTVQEILDLVQKQNLKGEFVLLLDNKKDFKKGN